MTVEEALRYDPFSPEAMRDPARFYPILREEHPAYYLPQYDAYTITRFADVWDGFLDSKNFSEAEGQIFSREQLLVHNNGKVPESGTDPYPLFNYADPPLHTRFRQVMAPSLLKPTVNRMEDDIVRLTLERLDALMRLGTLDLNHDFASHVSAGATCLVEGIPLSQVPDIIRLVNAMMARDPDTPGFTEGGRIAGLELYERLTEVVTLRRTGRSPENLLLDALIHSEIMGRKLRDAEIVQNMVSIIVGGSETVPKVFAGGLLELWKRPDQLAAVAADPDANVVPAFEEMLRYRAPAQWFGRTVKHARTLAGVELQPGQRVLLVIAAANRDPREFDDPEAFLWNRKARRQLSFGIGPHFCIGIHIARLEGQVMLRELLKTVPRFEIDEEAGSWAVSEFQIGWTKLPIRIAA